MFCFIRSASYWLLVAGLLLPAGAVAADKPLVVSSIRPLQLLVEELSGGAVDAYQLLPGRVSPHLYQLRPSDRRLLANADHVLWFGPALETFLQKPVALLPAGRSTALTELVLAAAESQQIDDHDHDHDHDHEAQSSQSEADEHNHDSHIWLDPIAVSALAEPIAELLMQLAPAQAEAIAQRAKALQQRLLALDSQWQQRFAANKQAGYLVLHDGYGHFEQRYGLQHRAAFTLSPERPPGAKKLLQIRQLLASGEVSCVLTEPQFQPAVLQSVMAGFEVKTVELDLLATESKNFVDFWQGFAEDFYRCLYQY